MSAEPQHQWIRVRLRPAMPAHHFLAQHVYPYVQTVLETGMADSFSFFREAEPLTVVLYFKGQADVLQYMLLPNTIEHFQRLLGEFAVNGHQYQPDLLRYGGPTGHFLSMLQYRAASEMVLEQLSRHRHGWSLACAADIARRLHLDLLFRLQMSPATGRAFFQQLYEHHRYGQGPLRPTVDDGTLAGQQYARDREWWDQLHRQPPTDAHWCRWDSMQQIIGNSLERALVQGKLRERPAADLLRSQRRGNHDRAQLWSYYADFVRLTNNRLGLPADHETTLYASLARSLHRMDQPARRGAPRIVA